MKSDRELYEEWHQKEFDCPPSTWNEDSGYVGFADQCRFDGFKAGLVLKGNVIQHEIDKRDEMIRSKDNALNAQYGMVAALRFRINRLKILIQKILDADTAALEDLAKIGVEVEDSTNANLMDEMKAALIDPVSYANLQLRNAAVAGMLRGDLDLLVLEASKQENEACAVLITEYLDSRLNSRRKSLAGRAANAIRARYKPLSTDNTEEDRRFGQPHYGH